MATDVYINIKDLPELTEINNGDYIIVETSTGTHIINFENFLLPTANTVISTTVNQNASSFTTSTSNLSTNINDLITTTSLLSSSQTSANTTISSLSTSVTEISSKLDATSMNLTGLSASYELFRESASKIASTYISKTQITIPAGSNQASDILTLKLGYSYSIADIIITPANKYATKYIGYPVSLNSNTGLVTIAGVKNNPALTINFALSTASISSSEITIAEEDAIYNVILIKT